jgi:hypothetical protein
MTEKPKTYRQDPATGEWEQVPEREPIIANWDALWIFAVTVGAAFIASIVIRLVLWN